MHGESQMQFQNVWFGVAFGRMSLPLVFIRANGYTQIVVIPCRSKTKLISVGSEPTTSGVAKQRHQQWLGVTRRTKRLIQTAYDNIAS